MSRGRRERHARRVGGDGGGRPAGRPRARLGARSLVAVAAVAFAVHAETLRFGFVWDDATSVGANPQIESLANVPAMFAGHAFAGAGEALAGIPLVAYYRPVWTLSLAVDHALWGKRPFGYHLTNVALHAAASALVAWLAFALLGSALAATLAGLLFAVHPAHAEAVAWVSARNELLCGLFMLLALAAYARLRAGGGWGARAAVAAGYGLALLSKETALVTPAIVLLYELRPGRRRLGERLRWPLALLLAAIPYLALRAAVVGDRPDPNPLAWRLLTAPGLLVEYARLLFAPVGLKVFHARDVVTDPLSAAFLAPALILAAGAALAPAAYRFDRALFIGLGWTLVALAPVAGIAGTLNPAPMADRYLYVPSAGWCLAMAALALALARRAAPGSARRALPVAASAALVVVLAAATVIQDRVWRSERTLMTRMTRDAPGSALGHAALGILEVREGNEEEAARALATAVRLAPGDGWFRYHLGDALRKQGRFDAAVEELRAAVRLGVGTPAAHHRLGLAYEGQNRLDEAIAAYRAALARQPDHVESLAALGLAAFRAGRWEESARAYEAAVALRPDDAALRQNLASLYTAEGRLDDAIRELRVALAARPDLGEAHFNLGVALRERGRHAEAERAFRDALRWLPAAANAHYLLGDVLLRQGRAEEAEARFREALRIAPDSAIFRRGLEDALRARRPAGR